MASGRSVSRRSTRTGLPSWAPLLQSAGVGHDEIAACHQVVHLVHGQRMDEVDPVVAAEEFLRSLADIRAEVHRINEVYIRICFAQLGNGAADVLHRFAVVLAAVRGNEDNAVVLKIQRFELLITELEIRLYRHVDCVNNRVAHDKPRRL